MATYDDWKTRSPDDDMPDPPEQWFQCEACCGEGMVGTGRMSHSVNSATIDPPFEIEETCRECHGCGGWLDEAKTDTDPPVNWVSHGPCPF